MTRTPGELDRAVGAVIGSAVGDALGAPHEFRPPHDDDWMPEFGPGVDGEPAGAWTDDTAMAVPILEALAAGRRAELERLATEGWLRWSREDGRGIGIQIGHVIAAVEHSGDPSPSSFLAEAERLHAHAGRSAGNGSLMRTGPLALAYLDDGEEAALADAARRLSRLTHWEDDAGDACVVWSLAVRHAIRTGELDVASGIGRLPRERRSRWEGIVAEASAPGRHPREFAVDALGRHNGWVVLAFQGALAAVVGSSGFPESIARAIRGGEDADTVAAIAGALDGALRGAAAIPQPWQAGIRGWPGYRASDLARLALLAADR